MPTLARQDDSFENIPEDVSKPWAHYLGSITIYGRNSAKTDAAKKAAIEACKGDGRLLGILDNVSSDPAEDNKKELTSTPITGEIHDAGWTASKLVYDKASERGIDVRGPVMTQAVFFGKALRQSETVERLSGYVDGVCNTVKFNDSLDHTSKAFIGDFMLAYLDGVCKQLNIKNPLQGKAL